MNRRTLLAAAPAAGALANASAAKADRLRRTLADEAVRRSVGFREKRSGEPGDLAAGEWMQGRLQALGYGRGMAK